MGVLENIAVISFGLITVLTLFPCFIKMLFRMWAIGT